MPVQGRTKLDLTDPDFDGVLERYDLLVQHLRCPGVPSEVLLLFADRLRIQECGCWLWAGSRAERGYGRFGPGSEWADSFRNLAHRASVTFFTGERPGELVVDHTCPKRSCVAPHHLQSITHAENVSLGSSRKRLTAKCGEDECLPQVLLPGIHQPTGTWVQRWRKSWETLKGLLPAGAVVPERLALFAAYVDLDAGLSKDPLSRVSTGCWEWRGASQGGYGFVTWAVPKGRSRYAHLWSHDWFGEGERQGLHLDHLCRNRLCLRPDHLELVTSSENAARGIGVSAKQAAKTHCHRGHPFTGETLEVTEQGYRICRTCRRATDRKNQKARRQRIANGEPARRTPGVCPNQHPYTEESTRIDPHGRRRCRICVAEGARRYRARQKAEKGSGETTQAL